MAAGMHCSGAVGGNRVRNSSQPEVGICGLLVLRDSRAKFKHCSDDHANHGGASNVPAIDFRGGHCGGRTFCQGEQECGAASLLFLAALLGWGTIQRNEVYRSAVSLWSDTIGKWPGNIRAYNELANALDAEGRTSEALASYDKALQLKPDYAMAYYNKGESMLQDGSGRRGHRAVRSSVAH